MINCKNCRHEIGRMFTEIGVKWYGKQEYKHICSDTHSPTSNRQHKTHASKECHKKDCSCSNPELQLEMTQYKEE